MLKIRCNEAVCFYRYLVMAIVLGLLVNLGQAQTLVLNNASGFPYTSPEADGFLDIIVGRAFNNVGLTLQLIKTPPERALRNANAGIDDGDLVRIKGIDKTYTNLIRIPESIGAWHFVALTRNQNITVRNWRDLDKYSIGFVRGWKIMENNTKTHRNVSAVRSPTDLFSMLDKDRIDIALYSKWMGLATVKNKSIKGIRVLEPPLATREMYIYLNKKHSKFVNRIANELKKMKDSGEYQRQFNKRIKYLADN